MDYINLKQFEEYSKTGTNLIVFKTTWCGVCKMNLPILEKEVFPKFEGKVKVSYLDVEENGDNIWEEDGDSKFAIKVVPTFMLFKDGKLLWRAHDFQAPNIVKEQFEKATK